MGVFLWLQSNGVGLTGDVAELAKTHEWGVMVGALIFCGCLSAALLFGAFKFAGEIVSLYKQAIEANTKLSESIDKMSQVAEERNKEFREGIDAIGKTLNKFGEVVDNHEGRIGELEETIHKEGNE